MKTDMNFIKEKRFAWDWKKSEEMKTFFDPLAKKLNTPLFIKFGNFDFFRTRFPPIYFYRYINVNYGRVGGSKNYDSVFKLSSRMLKVFYYCYLLKDLSFYPRIHSETLMMMDPLYRHKIRVKNQNDELIKNKYVNEGSFNLKKFILRCVE